MGKAIYAYLLSRLAQIAKPGDHQAKQKGVQDFPSIRTLKEVKSLRVYIGVRSGRANSSKVVRNKKEQDKYF